MSVAVYVRVDAHRHRRAGAVAQRDFVDAGEFGVRFDIKTVNADFKRPLDFIDALAHPGKHDLGRVARGGEHALQFAAGDDVEAGTEPRQDIEYGDIGVRLDRVANQVATVGESGVERMPTLLNRGAGIDIARRAMAAGQHVERHLLGV